jgi:hypothetical protein
MTRAVFSERRPPRFKLLPAALLGLFLIWPLAAASGETTLSLERYAGKLRQVTVQIAGGDHKFLFDTGGGHTLISPAIAAALGCQPTGRIVGHRMNGDKFETPKCANVSYSIGSFVSQGETVGVFDLMSMLPKELPPLDGVISLASVQGRSLALDLGANKLIVDANRPASAGQPFPCRVATGGDGADYTLFAGVVRAGAVFWFEVDSGNLDAIRIAPHAARYFGLEGSEQARTIDLALGDGRSVQVEAHVVDMLYDGAISAAFLEQGVLYADLRQHPRCAWMAISRPPSVPRS